MKKCMCIRMFAVIAIIISLFSGCHKSEEKTDIADESDVNMTETQESETERTYTAPEYVEIDIPKEYKNYEGGFVETVIQSMLNNMDVICAGVDWDFWRFGVSKSETGENVFKNFCINYPTVNQDAADYYVEDLVATANWCIYDEYDFQIELSESMMYGINLEAFNDLCASEWQEVKGFDFAQGYKENEDGSVYVWVPIYYVDENGAIKNNEVYLFVLVIYPGADWDYLTSQAYYAYADEYRTDMLFLANQAEVKKFLKEMKNEKDFLQEDEAVVFEELSLDSTGEAVRQIQQRLVELGFLTSSIDGNYGPMTELAVMDFQKSKGLEETGIADAQTQKLLLSNAIEKELLRNWMETEH